MSRKNRKTKKNFGESFDKLKKNVGRKVKVEYIWYGVPFKKEGILKRVEDYVNIGIEGAGIPFIGYGSAIRKIVDENGNILYENPLIPSDYDLRDFEEIDKVRAECFGKEIAEKFRKERLEIEREWQRRIEELNKEARKNYEKYLKEGLALVKDEKRDEWKDYVEKNTQDFYSAGVVDVSIKIMKALSEGKTPEEAAEKEMEGTGITGFQAGCVAQTVSYFHPRGEEFREYWNRLFLSEEEAKKVKGVVNPAILTIEIKKK